MPSMGRNEAFSAAPLDPDQQQPPLIPDRTPAVVAVAATVCCILSLLTLVVLVCVKVWPMISPPEPPDYPFAQKMWEPHQPQNSCTIYVGLTPTDLLASLVLVLALPSVALGIVAWRRTLGKLSAAGGLFAAAMTVLCHWVLDLAAESIVEMPSWAV